MNESPRPKNRRRIRLAFSAVLAAAVAITSLLLAAGWAHLLALPTPRGSTAVLAATALAAAVVVAATAPGREDDGPLASVPTTMAVALLAAFAHQLLRQDGRPRLVESVSCVVAGQAVAVGAAAWIAAPLTSAGPLLVVAAAAAVAIAAAVCSGPWPLRAAGPLSVLLGAAAGWVVASLGGGQAGTGAEVLAGSLAGAGAGAVVAVWRTFAAPLPPLRTRPAALAAAAAPVALCGPGTYVVGRLLLG